MNKTDTKYNKLKVKSFCQFDRYYICLLKKQKKTAVILYHPYLILFGIIRFWLILYLLLRIY